MKKIMIILMVTLTIVGIFLARAAWAATAIVPDDYATIQDAVTAVENDLVPGEVIINSNAIFDEAVRIGESVTIKAGSGYSPVIERTSGWMPPIRIRALADTNTIVVLEGLEVRTNAAGSFDAITIANVSTSHILSVTLDHLFVDAVASQSAVAVASASINADIFLTIVDSYIQIEGAAAGSPECLRLSPYGYSIFATLRNNTFSFSHANGISISGGRDDKLVNTLIDANMFEGFTSGSGYGREGVDVSGTGTPGSSASPTATYVTNNLFLNTDSAIDMNGQTAHTHRLYANNNTIVNSRSDGIALYAYGTSVIEAFVANNIIAGSGDSGIYRQDPPTGTIDLTNNFNLLYNNAAGNWSGVTAGTNSLEVDPLFTDPMADNYRLQSESPVVDQGTNTPIGGLGFGFDLDGNTRVQDNDGNGSSIINMGTYEEPAAAPYFPASSGGGGCFIDSIGIGP